MDFTPEILTSCISQILKKLSNWKDETYYLKTSFFIKDSIKINRIPFAVGSIQGSWYLRNNNTKQYCKIPTFVGLSLAKANRVTNWFGPYAFVNGFETTKEGKYLMDMLKYAHLSPAAQRKVDDIMNTYKYWVQVDEAFMETLKERDRNKEVQNGSTN